MAKVRQDEYKIYIGEETIKKLEEPPLELKDYFIIK